MSFREHPNSFLFKKKDRNAIKRQERPMENTNKWKAEKENMKKLQEQFLKGKNENI